MVTHRLSTILRATKIVVLNQGRIEAIGNHGELMLECPFYQRLVALAFSQPVDKGQLTANR